MPAQACVTRHFEKSQCDLQVFNFFHKKIPIFENAVANTTNFFGPLYIIFCVCSASLGPKFARLLT
jgi:hypothetical protein